MLRIWIHREWCRIFFRYMFGQMTRAHREDTNRQTWRDNTDGVHVEELGVRRRDSCSLFRAIQRLYMEMVQWGRWIDIGSCDLITYGSGWTVGIQTHSCDKSHTYIGHHSSCVTHVIYDIAREQTGIVVHRSTSDGSGECHTLEVQGDTQCRPVETRGTERHTTEKHRVRGSGLPHVMWDVLDTTLNNVVAHGDISQNETEECVMKSRKRVERQMGYRGHNQDGDMGSAGIREIHRYTISYIGGWINVTQGGSLKAVSDTGVCGVVLGETGGTLVTCTLGQLEWDHDTVERRVESYSVEREGSRTLIHYGLGVCGRLTVEISGVQLSGDYFMGEKGSDMWMFQPVGLHTDKGMDCLRQGCSEDEGNKGDWRDDGYGWRGDSRMYGVGYMQDMTRVWGDKHKSMMDRHRFYGVLASVGSGSVVVSYVVFCMGDNVDYLGDCRVTVSVLLVGEACELSLEVAMDVGRHIDWN
ncbi:hypothetical protein Tco_0403562 [Tanacetum coccineum]